MKGLENGQGEERARQACCGEMQSVELSQGSGGGEKVSETLQGLELTELEPDCG